MLNNLHPGKPSLYPYRAGPSKKGNAGAIQCRRQGPPPQKEKSEAGTFQTSELIAIRNAAALYDTRTPKRLGYAQVSTTQNIYSHLIEQADTQSAERIADAIFRSEKKLG